MHAAPASAPAIERRVRARAEAPLRIALVAPLYESVPPRLYGGTERVVAYLADALVELGHDVTLFASGDARTRATLSRCRDAARSASTRRRSSPTSPRTSRCCTTCAVAPASSTSCTSTSTSCTSRCSRQQAARTVTTLHGRLDIVRPRGRVSGAWPQFPLVSISDHQRRPLPDANWLATVPTACRSSFVSARRRIAGLPRVPRPHRRPRNAPTVRSGSRDARACRCKIAAKVDPVGRALLRTSRSRRCSTTRTSSSSARSTSEQKREVARRRARRCCSRSTGPSRSGW